MPIFVCRVFAAVLVMTAVNYFPGFCQDVQMTFSQALDTALSENRELRASRSGLSAQRENIGIARSQLLPKIFFEERAMRTNNPPSVFTMKLNQQRFGASDFAIDSLNYPRTTNDYQTSFSFEQPVFVMKSFLGLVAAQSEFSAHNEDFIRKKEEITLNVARAYLKTHVARQYVMVGQRAVEDAREHVRIAEVRYKHGMGLYSDCLRTRTSLIEAEQKKITADKEYAVAKRRLGLLIGRSAPVSSADDTVPLELRELDHYIKMSASRRDVNALQRRHETAKTNVRIAESGYLPWIGVGGSYQYNDHSKLFGSEGDSWQLMAFLRWNLFDGFNRESERRKAQHQMAEVSERLKGLEEFVAFKIEESYLTVEEAKKTVELSLSALKAAEEGKRLVRSRYENSLSPVVDLIDVQLNVNRARADAVARENEYKLAVINLSYESGTILKDLGIE
ncbi:MAG: outer membrane protein TolC [Deltaproteobacteria bacterium]|nr:outer membrane protein TolC [Deltaproteobacteria bacterium]